MTAQNQQANKFTWGPEDIEITEPVVETTEETVDEAGALAENERQDKMTIAELTEEAGREMEMEQVEDEPKKAIHHATKRGAELAVARKEISADSCRAVIAGEITLQEAKAYGRDLDRHGNPVQSETKKATTPKKDKPVTLCIACGKPTKGGKFHPGGDMKMHRIADEYLRGERDLTDEQREYLETSGKLEQARERAEKKAEARKK